MTRVFTLSDRQTTAKYNTPRQRNLGISTQTCGPSDNQDGVGVDKYQLHVHMQEETWAIAAVHKV